MTAVDDRLLAMAEDVGRWRRCLRDESRDNSYGAFLVARADHLDALDAILEPTAADLVAARGPTIAYRPPGQRCRCRP
jgi:hypothetical protein